MRRLILGLVVALCVAWCACPVFASIQVGSGIATLKWYPEADDRGLNPPNGISFIVEDNWTWTLTGYQDATVIDGEFIYFPTPRAFFPGRSAAGSSKVLRFYSDLKSLLVTSFTTPDKSCGAFHWVLEAKYGTTIVNTERCDFLVDNPDTINWGNTSPPAGPDDVFNQPVNQDSFWANLFVPKQPTIDGLKDAMTQFQSWGPFGIWNAIHGSLSSRLSQTGAPINANHEYKLAFPTGYGVAEFDLTPYEYYIKNARLIMAASLWGFALWAFWRRVGGHVVQSG